MNAFSSPLESIAFDYFISDVSTIFVSNIWTWLAVFCAGAASFLWRAKSPVGLMQPASPEPKVSSNLTTVPSQTESVVSLTRPAVRRNLSVVIGQYCCSDKVVLPEPGYERVNKDTTTILESGDGVIKGKFVAYYYPEEESKNVCDDEQCEFGEGHAELVRLFKVDRLERMKEMNEMGWYGCQDLSVLSGDIVRLWDARLV